jgi:uncharacterized protein (DUF3820 family)
LWFGRYKDAEIREIPEDYLKWLVGNHQQGLSWRVDGLVLYLKRYLKWRRLASCDHLT